MSLGRSVNECNSIFLAHSFSDHHLPNPALNLSVLLARSARLHGNGTMQAAVEPQSALSPSATSFQCWETNNLCLW